MLFKSLSLSKSKLATKQEGDAPDGRFAGYGSVFNVVDADADVIMPGAFKRSIEVYGPPKMYVNHNSWDLPVGKWLSASEDSEGLWLEGEATMGMQAGSDMFAAVDHGTVDGLSVGILLASDGYELLDNGGRQINEVAKLVETSVVTYPANLQARIDLDSVKYEQIEAVATERELEQLLREVVGCSMGLVERC